MNRFFALIVILLVASGCNQPKLPADLIVINAKVYTVNDAFEVVEAMVVKDGKVVEVGTSETLQAKYEANETLDAEGRTIIPGMIDAHAHLYGLGLGFQSVDLVGTTSKKEALEKLAAFEANRNTPFISGRGWDQNDWEVKEFPTKEDLDSLFPNTPVALSRIDGHALWVNSKALEMAGVTADTKMPGGEVILKNGQPSGILVDQPMDLVFAIMPERTKELNAKALKEAEAACLKLGLTTVDDAGLDQDIIELIDSLQKSGEMKLRMYVMASNNPATLDYYLTKGKIKTDRLNVRSIKVYADGALGSRGAALKAPYTDQHGHYGAMITTEADLNSLAKRIKDAGYQMNTHAIGDSANVAVLRAYTEALKDEKDARWRVEHAQVVDLADMQYFSNNILPSVQPTHATSDMYWAEDRLGPERIKGAYAYQTLLKKAGMVALGTDFPVEQVNPMYTFYAAIARKDLKGYPDNGYHMEEALTREEALRGMTIWAAYSNFEENEKGSLESGKVADFVILDTNLMECDEKEIPNIKVLGTYINGEKVY